jgi:hypothetical protein
MGGFEIVSNESKIQVFGMTCVVITLITLEDVCMKCHVLPEKKAPGEIPGALGSGGFRFSNCETIPFVQDEVLDAERVNQDQIR